MLEILREMRRLEYGTAVRPGVSSNLTIKRGRFVEKEKIISFRHPDVCDWDDVVRSGLGVPSDATDADFDDYHQGLAEVIPFKPRRGTNKQTNKKPTE